MIKPSVSVIIPVYNVEKYIAQCLDSVVNQTLQDIEIICVDDCSTDGSLEIVKQYAARDERIKLVCKERNSGLSDSRNIGIENSVAPYIMFCDSDDWYAPDMCEKMLNAISKNDADLAVCGTNIIYEANAELKISDDEYFTIKYSGKIPVSDEVRCNCDVSAWNKIYKREIISAHNIRFPSGLKYEDAFFFNAYTLWAKDFFFIKDKLYNYRRRAGSIMNQTFKKESNIAIDHVRIVIEFFKYLNTHDLYESKYAYFWTSLFVPYFYLALWNTRNRAAIRDIFDLAGPFVEENYRGGLDFVTSRTLRMIARKTLHQTQKHLGGIIAIKETENRKIIRVCGVPFVKIKYFDGFTKRYFAGVQICTTHK